MNSARLARHFVARELRERYRGSFTGFGWALLQPLLQLAIYAFIFVQVFKARVPGADAPGYVPFLVVALWPWVAFSDALVRSTVAIQDNAALIGKVALPREVLVLAPCAASFVLHMGGFIAIVLALAVTGTPIDLAYLPAAVLLYIPLFLLALGFAFALAALQVFVRDLVQILSQLLMLLMFAAPVFYARESLPQRWQGWLDANPFTFYAEAFRSLLLGYGEIGLRPLAAACLVAAVVLLAGRALFRRLDPHFEDFL
ncbi:MAG TPA: ABC transporter permease [Dokdonella sp.]|uniref:ABC transporter permease n=1 Tax=Dokdonella sp. TaxID=2291710 RepID=UPI0025C4BABF|nr:ABC transporter permease [Dokdonella sp.]MBX3690800.1 ABC transporter permease [Dokdonella sp.]HNR91675.1 ABC transporter permease [Dokdonella sp.]